MGSEHPYLQQLHAQASAAGEIISADTTTITVEGQFPPGVVIPLHPGARVFILTEQDAIDFAEGDFR
ncbi:hypothetical protein [Mycobacterium marinum]|uniref:hypothetical protein n=1 Tax=Mycobacterium marinum TaxID=1781 RepID=UPI0002F6A4C0|nr:hypothetical protein [Mycobacterium marinum]